jgi:hypothetical protein
VSTRLLDQPHHNRVHFTTAEQDAAIARWLELHPDVAARRGPFDNGLARVNSGSAVHHFSPTAIERDGGLAVACMPKSYDRLLIPVDDSVTAPTCARCLRLATP